jgi:hypothetical protein
MEQTLNLGDIVRTCPNQIVSHLDGKSFASLTKVSRLFQAVCDAVPTKYLSIRLYDAVRHKNTNFINRLIAQIDSWMFTSETDDEIVVQNKSEKSTIKLYRCLFGKGVLDFFQTKGFLRFTQNNKTVRYLLTKMDKNDTNKCMVYLNIHECNDEVNFSLQALLSPKTQNLASRYNVFDCIKKPGCGGYIGCDQDGKHMHKYFSLSDPSCSTKEMRKQFGLITTFLVAAQKNRTLVTYSILNNTEIINSWSTDILEIALNDLDNNNEIKDIVAAKIFEIKNKK